MLSQKISVKQILESRAWSENEICVEAKVKEWLLWRLIQGEEKKQQNVPIQNNERNKRDSKMTTGQGKCQGVWLADLGWVRVPCRTRAVWEIHWERMLLRSWLTLGWLQI